MSTRFVSELTVTEDHVKLLGRLFIDWDDAAYNGAPAVDIKRPYGNSYVLGDLWEILRAPEGVTWDEEVFGEMSDELEAELLAIHEQMATVLQVLVIATAKGFPFRAGWTYRKKATYSSLSWAPVGGVSGPWDPAEALHGLRKGQADG